jgi:hypothetical protein
MRGDVPGSGGKRTAKTPRKISVPHILVDSPVENEANDIELWMGLFVMLGGGTGRFETGGWVFKRVVER